MDGCSCMRMKLVAFRPFEMSTTYFTYAEIWRKKKYEMKQIQKNSIIFLPYRKLLFIRNNPVWQMTLILYANSTISQIRMKHIFFTSLMPKLISVCLSFASLALIPSRIFSILLFWRTQITNGKPNLLRYCLL